MTHVSVIDWLTSTTLAGIPLANLLIAAAAALFAYLVMTIGLGLALSRLGRFANGTVTQVDNMLVDILGGTSRGLLALVALLIGVGMLDLPSRWADRVGQLWFIALALQLALWGNRAVGIGLRRYTERHPTAGTNQISAAATLVSWGLRTLLWAVVLLAMLSNLGVNITAFIASLGVGGIAIALAAQNVLGDLFASLAIAVDKPFEVGDAISVGGVSGAVEHVGVKTTRIRATGGEQIVMSNTELLKQTVSNYKRLRERRAAFTFGVTYDATPEQLEQIPAIVKRLVEQNDQLRFDRAHFKTLGESSLDFEVVYIVLDSNYGLFMDQQQRINLGLMRELAALGVQFAFPSRTVYMAPAADADAAQARAGAGASGRPGPPGTSAVAAPA